MGTDIVAIAVVVTLVIGFTPEVSQDIETQTSNSICETVTRKITGEVQENGGDSYINGDNVEGNGNGGGSENGHEMVGSGRIAIVER